MALQSARQSVLIYNVVWIIFILTPLGILFRKVVTYHGLPKKVLKWKNSVRNCNLKQLLLENIVEKQISNIEIYSDWTNWKKTDRSRCKIENLDVRSQNKNWSCLLSYTVAK